MVAPKILSLYASVWEPILSEDLTGHGIIEFTCLGKNRDNSRRCKLCDDWGTFVEDESLMDIMNSYQEFCYFFLTNEHIVRILEVKHEVDVEFNTFQLIDLVKEGLKGFPLLKKRKPPVNDGLYKGVVPLDIARKIRKTSTIDKSAVKNEPIPSPGSNIGEHKKLEPKRIPTEDTQVQDKTEKEKAIKTSCDIGNVNSAKGAPVNTTNTSIPIKPPGPVKGAVTLKTPIVTGTGTSVTPTAPKATEKITAGVKSPPLVTIKVEVQTTPEKPQTSIDGNESSNGPTSALTPDPLQDSVANPIEQQSRSPPKPMITIARPIMTNVVSQAPVTASVNTPSTIPYRITPTSMVSSQSPLGHQIIQIAHPGGLKTVSIRPQQIRLSSIPARIPVQILTTASGTSASCCPTDNTRPPIFASAQGGPSTTTAPGVKRRIIFTTATPHDLQRWPDTNKVLQFATGDLSRFPALAGIRPSLISVGQSSCPMPGIRTTAAPSSIRPVVTTTTLPLVRPPNTTAGLTSTSTVGQVGQAILTSSSGQGLQTQTAAFPFVRTMAPTTAAPGGSAVRPQCFTVSGTTVARQVPASPPTTTSSSVVPAKRKPEGCKCGNATPTPGKLTCIGQRCACYADRNACSDCKCKGCKNPYVPGSGGKKVLHGARALLDPQTNQTIPIMATPIGPGSSSSTIMSGNSTTAPTNPQLVTSTGSAASFGTLQTGVPSSTSQPVPPFQFIPVRFGNSTTPQYLQITNPQALQQMPFILSTSGHLQGNSATGITFQGIPVSGLSTGGLHIQQPRITQLNVKPEKIPEQPN